MRLTPKTVLRLTEYLADKVVRREIGGVAMCRYKVGETDATIAEACGVPVGHVKRVRRDVYGSIYLKRERGQARAAAPLAGDVDRVVERVERVVDRIVDAQAMRLIEATEKQMRKHERLLSHVRQMMERIEMHLAILHGRKIDESERSDAEAGPQGQLSV